MKGTVKFPYMRLDFDSALGDLASSEIQSKIWPNPPPFCGFDLTIHILFDDINIIESEDLAEDIGLNAKQVVAVTDAMTTIEAIWKDVGVESEPKTVCDHALWPSVIAAANRYFDNSNISSDFRAHLTSAEKYGKRFDPVNPYDIDESVL